MKRNLYQQTGTRLTAARPIANLRERASGFTGYIPTLDGWRAIAILLVLINHSPAKESANPWWSAIYELAPDGVKVFFAISGMLICGRLLAEEKANGSIDLKAFYTRRLFRIQPASLCYLAIIGLLTAMGLIQVLPREFIASILPARNFVPIIDPKVASYQWYTSHFWSLAVEEHFYLLLPGFLIICKGNAKRTTILATLSVLTALWRTFLYRHPEIHTASLGRTDLVLDTLLLGACAALSYQNQTMKPLQLKILRMAWPATLGALIIIPKLHPHFGVLLLSCSAVVCVFGTALNPKMHASRVLESRPLRWIGKRSFSLYLWQQLFFACQMFPVPNTLGLLQRFPFNLAVSLLMASLSYTFIEQPLVRMGHRLASSGIPGRIEDDPSLQLSPPEPP